MNGRAAMRLFTGTRPAGLGWIELRFYGGPADGSRTFFRRGRDVLSPSPRLLLRDPGRADAPLRAGENVHVYRYTDGPNGRGYYHYMGLERYAGAGRTT